MMTLFNFKIWLVLVTLVGLVVVATGIFEPGLRFSARENLIAAGCIDFLSVGFSLMWMRLHK